MNFFHVWIDIYLAIFIDFFYKYIYNMNHAQLMASMMQLWRIPNAGTEGARQDTADSLR